MFRSSGKARDRKALQVSSTKICAPEVQQSRPTVPRWKKARCEAFFEEYRKLHEHDGSVRHKAKAKKQFEPARSPGPTMSTVLRTEVIAAPDVMSTSRIDVSWTGTRSCRGRLSGTTRRTRASSMSPGHPHASVRTNVPTGVMELAMPNTLPATDASGTSTSWTCTCSCHAPYSWARSRVDRNREQHAMNGNVAQKKTCVLVKDSFARALTTPPTDLCVRKLPPLHLLSSKALTALMKGERPHFQRPCPASWCVSWFRRMRTEQQRECLYSCGVYIATHSAGEESVPDLCGASEDEEVDWSASTDGDTVGEGQGPHWPSEKRRRLDDKIGFSHLRGYNVKAVISGRLSECRL